MSIVGYNVQFSNFTDFLIVRQIETDKEFSFI
jgi:hypothetical protein